MIKHIEIDPILPIAYVPLTKKSFAIIDSSDVDKASGFNWHIDRTGYAVRRPNKESYYLHRAINNTPPGMFTDHINGNTLDDRKENLRTVTHQQNMMNQRKQRHTTSHHKGVTWNKNRNKWHAQIKHNGKQINLGSFSSEEAAAAAYKQKAQELFGEYHRVT